MHSNIGALLSTLAAFRLELNGEFVRNCLRIVHCHTIPTARRGEASLASGFDRGEGSKVGREVVGVEAFDLEGKQAEGGNAEIDRAARAVHRHGDADNFAAVAADDFDGFLDAPAFGDDVFDDEDSFAGGDFESAAEGEFAIFFFDKDEAEEQLAGNFLAKDQAAHGRRDDGGGCERADLASEFCAEFFDDGHLLEGKGALKVLPAVEAAAEDEMAFEESAGVPEELEDFAVGHCAEV